MLLHEAWSRVEPVELSFPSWVEVFVASVFGVEGETVPTRDPLVVEARGMPADLRHSIALGWWSEGVAAACGIGTGDPVEPCETLCGKCL